MTLCFCSLSFRFTNTFSQYNLCKNGHNISQFFFINIYSTLFIYLLCKIFLILQSFRDSQCRFVVYGSVGYIFIVIHGKYLYNIHIAVEIFTYKGKQFTPAIQKIHNSFLYYLFLVKKWRCNITTAGHTVFQHST